MKILILTRTSDDACTGQVQAALEELGHQGIRFNTDLYPQDAQLSTSYHKDQQRRVLCWNDAEIDLNELGAVYYRRFQAAARLPRDLGDMREACYQESLQTIYGSIASLPCFQLDPFCAVRQADHKELQLKVALELGLDCPRTCFSNDPRQVRRFADEVGPTVAKLQVKAMVRRQGEQQAVFTSLLSPEDLADMEGLRYSPMMFQERIEKERELRVTLVGSQLFSAAIDSTLSELGQVDWRLDDALSYGWEPWDLPEDIADRLRRLVSGFGLNYSAADFILTPDGRYVFLEINSMGEWMWLFRDLDLRIDRALASALTEPSRRLASAC